MEHKIQCRSKSCQLPPLTTGCARVEVKAPVPKGGLSKHKNQLLVNWKKNGEATFHRECWDQLVTEAQKRIVTSRKFSSVKKDRGSNRLTLMKSEKLMIKEASKTEEIFDSLSEVKQQAEIVARMIGNAQHCVVFTGAGISTAAGLGDFRGKGGKWTEQDRDEAQVDAMFADDNTEPGPSPAKKARSVGKKNASSTSSKDLAARQVSEENADADDENQELDYECLRPTLTHEVIRQLVEDDKVKYVISQNCDGLHRLSGIPPEKISELHGNVFVEKCEECGTTYNRPYYVCDDVADIYLEELSDFGKTDIIPPPFMKKCEKCGLSHRTGRRCEREGCSGFLSDTIINFCDDLEEDILTKAFDQAKQCDLLLCLGTTLAVTPACNIVHKIKRPRRIVICNRQVTEKDGECIKTDKNGQRLGARIHGDCDVFTQFLMEAMLGDEKYQEFKSSLCSRKATYEKQRT